MRSFIWIKRISLNNFQSHRKTELAFSPGLNVILGPSDQGKSSIIRALRWVIYNEPSGTEFIRKGERNCSVEILLSDNTKITRLRNSKENKYILEKPSGEISVFEGFGYEVPLEICHAHGMSKVALGGNVELSLNISEQMEGPFLLTDSGANRAKSIGGLIGVHVIDAAIQGISRDITRNSQEERALREELNVLNERIAEFSFLPDLKKGIEQTGEIMTKSLRLKQEYDKLLDIQAYFKMIRVQEKELKSLIGKLQTIPKVRQTIVQAENYISLFHEVQNLRHHYCEIKNLLNEDCRVLRSLIMLPQILKNTGSAQELVHSLRGLQAVRETFLKIEEKQRCTRGLLEKSEKIAEVSNRINEKLLPAAARLKELKGLRDAYSGYVYNSGRLKVVLSENAVFGDIEKIVKNICQCREKQTKLRLTIWNWRNNEGRIESTAAQIRSIESEIRTKLDELKNLIEQVRRCPLCLQEISAERIPFISIKESITLFLYTQGQLRIPPAPKAWCEPNFPRFKSDEGKMRMEQDFESQIARLKDMIDHAQRIKYQAEARMEQLEKQRAELVEEMQKMNVTPDNIDAEIKRLEEEIVRLIKEAEELLPYDLLQREV